MANILLVTHIYPPATDGGSKVIAKVGDYLQSQGHQIMVLTSNCHSSDEFIKKYTPISKYKRNVIALSVYTFLRRPFKLFSPLSSLFSVCQKGPIFKLIPFIKALISILKFRPDYIIAGPLPTTIVLYARLIRFLTKVLSHHRAKILINASFHPTDQSFQQPILINTLQSADYLWTLTDFETDYFHKNFNIPKTKMINVGNGIDSFFLTTTPSPHRTNALLFVGSFAAHKGIETLIEAFVLLSSSKAPSRYRANALSLVLAGQPTLYSPIIENKINALPAKIKSKIKIIYNFPSNDLKLLMDQSSILISPSTQESFGLVLLEAMARGKPVIAADIPASHELVTKSHAGLLFQPSNPHDLVSKVLKFYRSNALPRYSTNALTFASQRTWDKIGKLLWQKISS